MSRRDEEKLERLKQALTELGPFRRGSVQERMMPCGKPGCRCQASPPRLHGPYYQWTRKVQGKTVTVRLTPQQARLIRKWIANSKRFDKLIAELEEVSFRLTAPTFDALGKR